MPTAGFAPMWRPTGGDWPLESVLLTVDPETGLSVTGTQLGMEPCSYRADYQLETGPDVVTRSLRIQVVGDGFARALELLRDEAGAWTCDVVVEGTPPVGLDEPGPAAGTDLRGALDCDIALSPLTNLLPIRRLGLHVSPGRHDLVMAFVSMPDLAVRASAQRYEHVAPGEVRYTDLGVHPGFEAVLAVDEEGLVVDYPGLARRVGAAA